MFVEGEGHLRLAAVRVAGSGVAEMNGARPLIFVPRGDVIRLEARYRSAAELPLLSLLLGLLLLAVALLFAIVSVNAWRGGPRYPFKAILTFIAFAYSVPAAWVLNLSLRKRWFICVHQRRGRPKLLSFRRHVDERAIHAFVENAHSRFGY
jgi:hypothetical protein